VGGDVGRRKEEGEEWECGRREGGFGKGFGGFVAVYTKMVILYFTNPTQFLNYPSLIAHNIPYI
jgi:hypothetical protein